MPITQPPTVAALRTSLERRLDVIALDEQILKDERDWVNVMLTDLASLEESDFEGRRRYRNLIERGA